MRSENRHPGHGLPWRPPDLGGEHTCAPLLRQEIAREREGSGGDVGRRVSTDQGNSARISGLGILLGLIHGPKAIGNSPKKLMAGLSLCLEGAEWAFPVPREQGEAPRMSTLQRNV